MGRYLFEEDIHEVRAKILETIWSIKDNDIKTDYKIYHQHILE